MIDEVRSIDRMSSPEVIKLLSRHVNGVLSQASATGWR